MDSSSGKGRPHQMNRQDAKDAKEIESLEKVVIGASIGYELQELGPPRKGTLLPASPPGIGRRSVRSVRSVRSKSGSIPALVGTWLSFTAQNLTAELGLHRNNTVAAPG